MQQQRECRGAILIKIRTPEQRERKVQPWACMECAAEGCYPLEAINANKAAITVRHTWQPGPTGMEKAIAEADAQEAAKA